MPSRLWDGHWVTDRESTDVVHALLGLTVWQGKQATKSVRMNNYLTTEVPGRKKPRCNDTEWGAGEPNLHVAIREGLFKEGPFKAKI